MKILLFATLLLSTLLFSCKKEELSSINTESNGGSGQYPKLSNGLSERMNCEPFQFGIIALDSGAFTSYNMNIIGNLGYSKGVSSTTNNNLALNGNAYVHSNVTSFIYSVNSTIGAANVFTNDWADSKIEETNFEALNVRSICQMLAPDFMYSTITSSRIINSRSHITGNPNTVVNVGSINLNDERLTLIGNPSSDDGFIINVTGNGIFDESEIKLINARPERVIFNFTSATAIVQVKNDSRWRGTILAPTGTVTYYNPKSFQGSIVAKTINAVNTSNIFCSGSNSSVFVQKTYCNGYQW